MFDFIKYHGLGNDFALFVGPDADLLPMTPETARRICSRGTGVGADGVMRAGRSERAALKMELLNADGSIPEMCGNGLRCLVKYAVEQLKLSDNPLRIETGAGVLACDWQTDRDGHVIEVKVAMGRPCFEREHIAMSGQGSSLNLTIDTSQGPKQVHGVGIGNPHMVLFEYVDRATVDQLGPELSAHPLWPNGTNVEWVSMTTPTVMDVLVYERGCGVTQACGTGATAAAAVATRLGMASPGSPLVVNLLGGSLAITLSEQLDQAWMAGPCEEVYRGQWWPR